MHSLIGSFVIDTLNQEPEIIEGLPHRKLEIKISEFFKRIFYIPCNKNTQNIVNSGGDVFFGGNPSSYLGTIGRMGGNESLIEEE